MVQLPARIAAVLGQAVLTHALTGGLVHDLVGPAERQQTRVLHLCKQQKVSTNLSFFFPRAFLSDQKHRREVECKVNQQLQS